MAMALLGVAFTRTRPATWDFAIRPVEETDISTGNGTIARDSVEKRKRGHRS